MGQPVIGVTLRWNLKEFQRGSKKAIGIMGGVEKSARMLSNGVGNAASIFTAFGATATAAAGLSTVAIALTTKAAGDLEESMLNVQKTTDETDASIERLRQSFIALSKDIPIAAQQLAEIAAKGGQLGITGVKNLELFTETVGKIGAVTDLSTDRAAISMARLSTLFDLPISQARKLGSAMNELSNKTTATVANLDEITRRFGGTANAMGITAAESLALSATLTDLGVTQEIAGTNLINLSTRMGRAVDTFGALTKAGVENFRKVFAKDKLKAIQLFTGAFEGKDFEETATQLAKIGIRGGRLTQVVLALANGQAKLTRNLKIANDAFESGTSLQAEFVRIMQGLNAQMRILKNRFQALLQQVGSVFIPVVKLAVQALGLLFNMLSSIPTPIIATMAVFASFMIVLGLFAGAISFAIAGALLFIAVLLSMAANFVGLLSTLGLATSALTAFNAGMTNSIILGGVGFIPVLAGMRKVLILVSGAFGISAVAADAFFTSVVGGIIAVKTALLAVLPFLPLILLTLLTLFTLIKLGVFDLIIAPFKFLAKLIKGTLGLVFNTFIIKPLKFMKGIFDQLMVVVRAIGEVGKFVFFESIQPAVKAFGELKAALADVFSVFDQNRVNTMIQIGRFIGEFARAFFRGFFLPLKIAATLIASVIKVITTAIKALADKFRPLSIAYEKFFGDNANATFMLSGLVSVFAMFLGLMAAVPVIFLMVKAISFLASAFFFLAKGVWAALVPMIKFLFLRTGIILHAMGAAVFFLGKAFFFAAVGAWLMLAPFLKIIIIVAAIAALMFAIAELFGFINFGGGAVPDGPAPAGPNQFASGGVTPKGRSVFGEFGEENQEVLIPLDRFFGGAPVVDQSSGSRASGGSGQGGGPQVLNATIQVVMDGEIIGQKVAQIKLDDLDRSLSGSSAFRVIG